MTSQITFLITLDQERRVVFRYAWHHADLAYVGDGMGEPVVTPEILAALGISEQTTLPIDTYDIAHFLSLAAINDTDPDDPEDWRLEIGEDPAATEPDQPEPTYDDLVREPYRSEDEPPEWTSVRFITGGEA